MRRPTLLPMVALGVVLAGCGVNQTPEPEPGPELPRCVPDRDGRITADELPISLGATSTFYASPPGVTRTIDLAPDDGRWDLSTEYADDLVLELGPAPLRDQWYASAFPSGAFVVDAGAGLDGIYHQDAQALWLDGTASREMSPSGGRTLVRYAQPIAVLRFPIIDGDTYAASAELVDSTVAGLPLQGTDEVEIEVRGGERLDVPYVRFSPVMQVRMRVTRTPSTGTPVVTRRTTIFLFECFGEIARAESRQDEPLADFTTAAYLRRFALGVSP